MITFQGSNIGRFFDFNIGFSALDSLGYVTILTRNSERLSIENFFLSVRGDMEDTLSVQQLDSLLYINGNLTGISISKDSPPLSFFDHVITSYSIHYTKLYDHIVH